MNRISIIFLLISCCLLNSCTATKKTKAPSSIAWMSLAEVTKQVEKHPKKVFIDVYTDWCGYCKKMEKTTFQDPRIIAYINKHYYAIKLDAEMKEAISFKGKDYKYVVQGSNRYHQLAATFLKGRLAYPSIVVLDEQLEVIQPIPGYKDAKTLDMIISYFAKNEHKKTPWNKYQKNYKSPFN